MDKVKQNIILQQQFDKFNLEKSVIGTEAYYINQDIQKGLSQDEIIEKARSGIYKLTAENKKMGRVGQKYGESKKEETGKDALNSKESTDKKEEEDILMKMKDKVNFLFKESDKYFEDYSNHKISREESKNKRQEAKSLRDKYETLKEKYFEKYNLDPSEKSTFKFQLDPESY